MYTPSYKLQLNVNLLHKHCNVKQSEQKAIRTKILSQLSTFILRISQRFIELEVK
jgi:hypothetical protein